MKNISIIIFILIGIISILNSETKNIGDNYQIVYNILDDYGNFVSTEIVSLSIKKVSNDSWYDFSNDSFKISGWTSKTMNLNEDATNQYYYYDFNPPASETIAEQYIFILNNSTPTYRDHSILVVNYQDLGTSTTTPKEIWNYATREINGGTVDNLTTNLDKTGYSGVLTEYVTAYTLLDKNNFNCILATPTPKGIEDIANSVWDELQSGHTSAGTFGKYLDAQISNSSGTWSNAEKERVKSALTIEGSTPTWRLDMIDRDIRIFR